MGQGLRRQKRPNANSTNYKTENASIITHYCAAIFNESRANQRHKPQTVTYADSAPICIQSTISYKRKRGRNKNKSAGLTRNRPCDAKPLRMLHHVFTKGEWRRMRFREHPTVNLNLSTNSNDYKSFGLC